jgi:hypothetical protein
VDPEHDGLESGFVGTAAGFGEIVCPDVEEETIF